MIGSMPYYITSDKAFPCSISADKVLVDFKTEREKPNPLGAIYTESEIKQKLGIFLVDSWNKEQQKVVKISNKTVSSISKKTSNKK